MYKSVQDINREYGVFNRNIKAVQRLYDKGFDDSDVVDIFNVFAETCSHRMDGNNNCQCWNDN